MKMPVRLEKMRHELTFLPRALRLAWAAAPRLSTVWVALLLCQGLLPAALLYSTKLTIDSLVMTVGRSSDWTAINSTLLLVALTAALLVAGEALQIAIDWMRSVQAEYVQDHVTLLIQRQALNLDLGTFERPEFHDRLDQVRSEAASRTRALLETVGTLIQNLVTLVAMGAALMPYGLWVPLLLLIGAFPTLVVVARNNNLYHRWWQEISPERRRAQYFDLLMTHSNFAAEVRAYGLGAHLQQLYRTLRQRLRRDILAQQRRQNIARMLSSIAAMLVAGIAMAWMVWRALIGTATLGDLALFYQAFSRGQGVMRSLLGSAGQIYGHTLFVRNVFEFLALQPQIADPVQPMPAPDSVRAEIRFHGVSFRYPESERLALDSLDLVIPAGQVVAVVGPNGAGKSTIVKLLERFYDPQEGAITIDGVDLRALRQRDLRRLITVLFQFPLPYHMTASQNIAFGDVETPVSQPRMESAARSAGAHDLISRLPQVYETPLGKWFAQGSELSGGEWQRVATARAYYRGSPIIVLDEPTSAMDSWAESDWFERLRRLARGRTSLIITHRFTIAMRADIIHVLDSGRIAESGTHDELIARDGLYAQSWRAQMLASAAGVDDAETSPTLNFAVADDVSR